MHIFIYRSIFITVLIHINVRCAEPVIKILTEEESLLEVNRLAKDACAELLKISHQQGHKDVQIIIEKADQFREDAWEILMPVIKAQKTTTNQEVVGALKYLIQTGEEIANARDDEARNGAVKTLAEEISSLIDSE